MKLMNRLVMTAAGLLLIVAGGLKTLQMLTEPILSKGFIESWQFNVLHIPLELALGVWLTGGIFRKMAWLAGVISFGGFCFYTLYLALGGAESCGCFGQVHVNPWITLFAVDVPVFAGLCIFRPHGERIFWPDWPQPLHFFTVAGLAVCILAFAAPAMAIFRPADITDRYERVNTHSWIRQLLPQDSHAVAEPNEIALQPAQRQLWPMLEHIDIADKLKDGLALVLMYHHDCSVCRTAIPEYERYNRKMAGGGEGAMHIAFVAIPPYGDPAKSPVPADTTCLAGRLDESKRWYMTSPVVVVLLDGAAAAVWEGQAPAPDAAVDFAFAGGGV